MGPCRRLRVRHVRLLQLHWRPAAHAQVDHLDEDREAHRKVDVALGDVQVEALADERQSDQQQERQGEHLHGRMAVDEIADWSSCEQHHAHRDDDGGDHDRQLRALVAGGVLHHADRGDHAVEAEDDVQNDDLRDDAGKPTEMLGYLLDISDRKRTEATLQEAERRWRSLLENVQLLVVGLDSMGNVEYVNPFFLSLTGYTQAEVLGKNWFENFLPSSHQQQVNTVFNEVLENNFHPHYTNPILTKSGEERFIAWNNTLLRDTEGNIIGTTSIGEDITQRQTVERIKNEFISIVSHELRTPLTAIRGSLGLLATGIYDNKPEKAKRMVEIALIDSDRLVRLVNDILDLERLDSGKVTLVKEVCEAAALMQQAVEGVGALADSAGITLCISPVSAQVWAAPDSIIQTLTNLLSNAIKFSPSNTTITLTAQPQPDHVLFQVKDQGRGIPVDKLEAIFGRFQQVDVSDSRCKGGTGLGLAICQSIVQQHGGRIWAESTVGEGSTFYFTLPVPPKQ